MAPGYGDAMVTALQCIWELLGSDHLELAVEATGQQVPTVDQLRSILPSDFTQWQQTPIPDVFGPGFVFVYGRMNAGGIGYFPGEDVTSGWVPMPKLASGVGQDACDWHGDVHPADLPGLNPGHYWLRPVGTNFAPAGERTTCGFPGDSGASCWMLQPGEGRWKAVPFGSYCGRLEFGGTVFSFCTPIRTVMSLAAAVPHLQDGS